MTLQGTTLICAEVKFGESVKGDPAEFEACIHLSQAALGEAKKGKANEPVVVYLKVGEQKFVLGTLSRDKIPQISLELVLEKEFELSHSSKNVSVHFCGYKIKVDKLQLIELCGVHLNLSFLVFLLL